MNAGVQHSLFSLCTEYIRAAIRSYLFISKLFIRYFANPWSGFIVAFVACDSVYINRKLLNLVFKQQTLTDLIHFGVFSSLFSIRFFYYFHFILVFFIEMCANTHARLFLLSSSACIRVCACEYLHRLIAYRAQRNRASHIETQFLFQRNERFLLFAQRYGW